MSITSGYGGLPSANITVPAQAGLMDIARFYSPKVHVFFSDRILDYNEKDPDDIKRQDRLLFSGVISQVAYTKNKNIGANVGISFSCTHRYSLLDELLIDYTGWLNKESTDSNPSESAVMGDNANSPMAVIEALSGILRKQDSSLPIDKQVISENNPEGSTSTLPNEYSTIYNRIIGMPGVIYNYWAQLKRSAFNRALRQGKKMFSESFVKMYQPLVEDGLMFLDRVAGHFPIEAMIQNDMYRVEPCPKTNNRLDKILIPPGNQVFLSSSVQAEMAYSNISNFLQASGEVTTIYGIFAQFYDSIDYDLLTLTSPAEAFIPVEEGEEPGKTRFPVDTIVKPKIPFYFSPTCNVLFPGMYHSVNVMYDEMNMPTRINIKNIEGPGGENNRTSFRAPHSVRAAIAEKAAGRNGEGGFEDGTKYNLSSTLGSSWGAIGRYEQGRGIKQQNSHMPRWLSLFSKSTFGATQQVTDENPDATTEPGKVEALKQLAAGWAKRYPGPYYKPLNPYEIENTDINAHHRLLFTAADYSFTQSFARSKVGSVDGPFNPFIVPGYPMDILEQNPLYPSFHAMCTNVTHTITAESVSTNIQFAGAMTYSELANYYIPFSSPMVQVALKLADNPTLMGHDRKSETVKTGDAFYKYTLGVTCATPSDLLDTNTMKLKPKAWNDDGDGWTEGDSVSRRGKNGGELNPMLSFEGNLSMVYRPIESRYDIEQRFGHKFIDMTPANYSPNVMRYKDERLTEETKYEIGQNPYLTYNTYFGKEIKKGEVTSNASGDATAATPSAVTKSPITTTPAGSNLLNLTPTKSTPSLTIGGLVLKGNSSVPTSASPQDNIYLG